MMRSGSLEGAIVHTAEQLDLIAFLAADAVGDAAARSTPAPGVTDAAAAWVQNEHTCPAPAVEPRNAGVEPGTAAAPMSPRRLLVCLAVLRWTERELARRTGRRQTEVRCWTSGGLPVRDDVAAWLETLTAFHEAHPAPRPKRRRVAQEIGTGVRGSDNGGTESSTQRLGTSKAVERDPTRPEAGKRARPPGHASRDAERG